MLGKRYITCFKEKVRGVPVLEIIINTVKVLSIGTDRCEQTVQTQIRLLFMEQSDQGLHYLLFHPHLFGCILAV